MSRRVVITGIGPVSAAGIGKDAFFNNVCSNPNLAVRIPQRFRDRHNFKTDYYIPLPDVDLINHGFPKSLKTSMEKLSVLSVIAAKLALIDAGYNINEWDKDKYFEIEEAADGSIILGIGMCSLQIALDSYAAYYNLRDDKRYNRMTIPMLMPNSASAWISILFGIKGVNYTLNGACAAGTYAIGEAYRRIKFGLSDMVITGGVESLYEECGSIMCGFDKLGTLTRSENGNPLIFCKGRSGFLFSEGGGCVLILEELERAKKRNAHIYAEIADFESNSEAYSIVQLDESGTQIEKLLRKVKGDNKIDYFNAHGTGTIQNDQVEAKIIQSIFGDADNQPYVNSTKGILGHTIGASGAFEAAVVAMSIENSMVHGNTLIDPIENLRLVPETMNLNIENAISASYGFGGHIGALLFKKYHD